MENLIKIVKSLEFWFIIKRSYWNSSNETKEQKGGFLSILLGTLGASLLGNISAGKGINKKDKGIIRAGEGATKLKKQGKGIVKAGYGHHSSKNKSNNRMDF